MEQGRDFVHRRVSRELLPMVLACGKADASCDDHSRIKNLVKVRATSEIAKCVLTRILMPSYS